MYLIRNQSNTDSPNVLPFESESIDSLKERYPKCIAKIWTQAEIARGDRPGLHREYVFDFESGLRLLISRALFGDLAKAHVSASWIDEKPLDFYEAEGEVVRAYKDLGGVGYLRFLGMSNMGIPHWIVEEDKNDVRT